MNSEWTTDIAGYTNPKRPNGLASLQMCLVAGTAHLELLIADLSANQLTANRTFGRIQLFVI
jgi:hypothetical protein